jgi:hypothetical protein
MPSRSSVPAWLAVLSLLILALLGLWMSVRGRHPAVPQVASTMRAASGARPDLERDFSPLDELPAWESGARTAVEQERSAPKKNRRFRGRVMSVSGEPCEDAKVLLYSPSWSMTVDFTRTKSDGAFELRYPHDGAFEVVARSPGNGTCDRVKIDLDVAQEQKRVELVLNRPDWLAGRLTDGADRPLGGVELWAFPAGFSSAGSTWLFGWRMRAECRTLRGECSSTTKTDDQGRFRFVDLEPGAYFIARRERLDPPHDPRIPHSTGESAIELFEEHVWLSLRCNGAPNASVFCAPVTQQGPADHLLRPSSLSDVSSGQALFDVEPCRVYQCGFLDPALGLVEEELSMPCRGGTVTHEFKLPERAARGSLTLRISFPWRLWDERKLRVRVRSAASGVLLMNWTQREWGSADLPAGEFVLDVVDPPVRDPDFPARDTVSETLLSRRRIVIRPDSETRVNVDA